jgi:hypothetical protein
MSISPTAEDEPSRPAFSQDVRERVFERAANLEEPLLGGKALFHVLSCPQLLDLSGLPQVLPHEFHDLGARGTLSLDGFIELHISREQWERLGSLEVFVEIGEGIDHVGGSLANGDSA